MTTLERMKRPTTRAAMTGPPKAYSYLRFSTPEQMRGDSYRRQSEAATSYAERHGLALDTNLTFEDLGVSGFRGANASEGQLAAFLEGVKCGQIDQGSYLLVENLDRLSRQTPRRAARVLEDIVDAGITVVTLTDQKAYTRASLDGDPFTFIMAVLGFVRANEESATKSRRVAEAWSEKRKTVAKDAAHLYSRRAPAWLEWSGSGWSLRPDRARIVRHIFEQSLAGRGQAAIARSLNKASIKPWGRARYWHKTYVKKILASPAVIGTLTPQAISHAGDGTNRKRRVAASEPVAGYYPAAIDQATWDAVAAIRNRGDRAPSSERQGKIAHVLAGLCVCPRCGSTMTRVAKGKRSRPILVCVQAKNGKGCQYVPVRVDEVETAILNDLSGHVLPHAPLVTPGAEAKLTALEREIGGIEDRIDRAVDELLRKRPSDAVTRALAKLESERDRLSAERDSLIKSVDDRNEAVVQTRVAEVVSALAHEPVDIQRVNVALRRVFKSVEADRDAGTLVFTWLHELSATSTLQFRWQATDEDRPAPAKRPLQDAG